MSSLDYLDLCRLCLVKDRVSVPIFDGEGDVRQIFLKIASCLPVKVAREDKLPKKICDDCVYKVELFYQFWNTTVNAEKQLLQWLGEVNLEDKQGYVTDVLNSGAMKEEQSTENRLDGNVIQHVGEHQNNMSMGMMDNMGLGIPIIISSANQQQQITSVPMDTSGSSVQTVQAVPGPSSQTTHNQIPQNRTSSTQHEDEEETEDEENSDEECDGDDGLNVKEESEDEPSNRTVEPTTFVNVPLVCDEAGPSGLQQQKISEIPEMPMPQSADEDPKSEFVLSGPHSRGIFIFNKESVVMKKWQILEFDGKPYYAFVPEGDTPLAEEDIPEQIEETGNEDEKPEMFKVELYDEEVDLPYDSPEERLYEEEQVLETNVEQREAEDDVKPIILNGTIDGAIDDNDKLGDLYQVKVQGSMVTIEKLTSNEEEVNDTKENLERKWYQEEQEEEYTEQEQLEQIEDDPGQVQDQEGQNEDQDQDQDQVEQVEYLEEEMLEMNNHTATTPAKRGRKPSKNTTGVTLKCKACSETFSSAVSFKKHVAWTHKKKLFIQEDGIYICTVCDYRTHKKSQFAGHLERKHDTWSKKRPNTVLFPCAACGFVCRSKHSLQSHFIRKHTDRYEHQCKFCTKKFKVKGDLTNHVRFHHKEKPINCDVCGKLCQNSGSLYVHQKWAHYKPKYECHICKRRMVTQENLDQHLLTQHEKREKIVCAECGKTFTKKDSFKRHMAVHTGCKPHSCLICNKPFARRSQLRQHLLIHTGKRPFVCDICGKAFTQKPGLICHRKTHPGPHPPLPVMPIADIVKEFTEGYVQEINARENEERIEEEA